MNDVAKARQQMLNQSKLTGNQEFNEDDARRLQNFRNGLSAGLKQADIEASDDVLTLGAVLLFCARRIEEKLTKP